MRAVKIITDSCSDLTPELLKEYNIDYVKMNTVFEGETKPADLAWTEADVKKFYGTMRDGKRFTTTQVPVTEYDAVFRKYLEAGNDIVYAACSIKQSGSVNTAIALSKKLLAEYPDAKIHCINSLRSCISEGMLAIEASKYAATGKDADEVASYITAKCNTVHEFATVHSLDYMKRAGRIKASTAFFGNLFGVKPIIVSDANGEQAAYKKVKGRQNSMHEIVMLLKEHIREPEKQTVYLSHADCDPEEVNQLKQMIRNEIRCKDIHVSYIGPIIGATVGPDTIAVFGFGDEVTFKAGENE